MTNGPSFSQLTEVHRWLDSFFLNHQLALLSTDFAAAKLHLEHYENNLRLHIDDEESRLIPLYDSRTANVPGGAVELFTGEHTKLSAFVGEFQHTLVELTGKRQRELALGIITLFDREAICKGLAEHHHAREENILFPWLDNITAPEERLELLESCASWRAYRAAQ
jgi:hypothetical protein